VTGPSIPPVPSGIGVTAARGFRAAGIAAGLKSSGAPDVAVVVNDGPRHGAAGVFTANRVKAAPVRWCESILAGPGAELAAVVLNSGGANACTGPEGYADTVATAEHLGALLDVPPPLVGVASTGLIGLRLPMDILLPGIDVAARAATSGGGLDAAIAIMTTDSVPKTVQLSVGGFTVGGMAKGAGMLAPGLATMLVVLTTDAVADSAALDTALRAATRVSFDRLDSDGAMSTNDTVLLLASGASGVEPPPDLLRAAVTRACSDLAGQLLADAEGATKEIAIEVPFPAILVAQRYGFGVQRLEDGISRLDAVGLVILANADDARQGALECVSVPGAALGAPPAHLSRPGGNNRGRRRYLQGRRRQHFDQRSLRHGHATRKSRRYSALRRSKSASMSDTLVVQAQ